MTNRTLLKRLVAFAVLMESGRGIMTKHPDYVLEKWQLTLSGNALPEDLLTQAMDFNNKEKFRRYLKEWKIK